MCGNGGWNFRGMIVHGLTQNFNTLKLPDVNMVASGLQPVEKCLAALDFLAKLTVIVCSVCKPTVTRYQMRSLPSHCNSLT